MAEIPYKHGHAPFEVPSIDVPCSTYYKIVGDLTAGSPPLVVLHGGPGGGHEYMFVFAELWPRYGIPVVFYDQIGCAGSTRLPHLADDKSLWQEKLFLSELDNLIDHLKLRDGAGFHLLGHSWGGSLVAAYASQRPRGMQRLVIASGLADKKLSIKGRNLQRKEFLPLETQQVLDEGDAKGDFQSPAYKEAMGVYYKTCMCRADPYPPPEMVSTLENIGEFKAIGDIMNGPSPWQSVGTMENWSCIERLPNITAPTLVWNGEFDTSHDIATAPFFELIPRVRWLTMAGAGHMSFLEGEVLREKTMKLVGEFLMQEKHWTV